jgi:hypothetical protein
MRTLYTSLADEMSSRPVQCDNCLWIGEERQTQAIADLGERVSPGETVPVGECPECGSLCHFIREDA